MRVVKSVQSGTTTVSIFSGSSVIAEYDNGALPSAPSRERKNPRCLMPRVSSKRSPTMASVVSRSVSELSSRANSTSVRR